LTGGAEVGGDVDIFLADVVGDGKTLDAAAISRADADKINASHLIDRWVQLQLDPLMGGPLGVPRFLTSSLALLYKRKIRLRSTFAWLDAADCGSGDSRTGAVPRRCRRWRPRASCSACSAPAGVLADQHQILSAPNAGAGFQLMAVFNPRQIFREGLAACWRRR